MAREMVPTAIAIGYPVMIVAVLAVLVWAVVSIRRSERNHQSTLAANRRVLATIGAFDSVARKFGFMPLLTHSSSTYVGRHRLDESREERTRVVWPPDSGEPTAEQPFAVNEEC